ncbi:hypothetical protein CBS147343_3391 [Aspergillus niger]|uniref:Uncharacterized protein n=1 Tax=Aspergillus niger TaxID=5061 RepID=A0A9W6EEW2_ASPNG|nr:hypothetical protein CBS133816_3548 [Aspergillus niger]KAI2837609.1 hypothetical protein CBS11350_8649 [Aspergillus niger]KAI2847457.1 hypothetical protein CBS12448_9308 [Aspergillus niger]KAI2948483.1 hypothetical protein CBS147321_2543 [Aspergillus niger]KAI2968395.1 hypothetical protein CBS147324_6494 [Aspergillus niger]
MKTQTLAVLSVLSALASAIPTTSDSTQNVTDIINNIPQSPNGVLYLGSDGVLRSIDAANRVVSYQQLSPQQISQYIQNLPQRDAARLQRVFQGVDGRDVTDLDQLLNPDSDQLPPTATSTVSQSLPTGTQMPNQDMCRNVGCTSQNTCRQNGCNSCLQAYQMSNGYCH